MDTWTCNGGNNQQWVLDETTAQLKSASAHMCLAAVASCTNIWGRRLRDGSWGMVMVNNGADNTTVTCGPDCFAQTTLTSSKKGKGEGLGGGGERGSGAENGGRGGEGWGEVGCWLCPEQP